MDKIFKVFLYIFYIPMVLLSVLLFVCMFIWDAFILFSWELAKEWNLMTLKYLSKFVKNLKSK